MLHAPAMMLPNPSQERQPRDYELETGQQGSGGWPTLLGRGAYGDVYAARDVVTGLRVAIKRVRDVFASHGNVAQLIRELHLHRSLCLQGKGEDHHPAVARLIDVLLPESMSTFRSVSMVFERLDGNLGSSTERWWSSLPPDKASEESRRAAHRLLSCLSRLHASGIVHRDVKPHNVLVSHTASGGCGRVALCDLGMARAVRPTPRTDDGEYYPWTDYVTTRWYRAPEVLAMAEYGRPADVWAVGCVLAEMLLRGRPLLPGNSTLTQSRLIGLALGPPSPRVCVWLRSNGRSKETVDEMIVAGSQSNASSLRHLLGDVPSAARDLIGRLLTYDPSERLTAEAASRHLYFAGLDDPTSAEDAPVLSSRYATFDDGGDGASLGVSEPRARLEVYHEITLCRAACARLLDKAEVAPEAPPPPPKKIREKRKLEKAKKQKQQRRKGRKKKIRLHHRPSDC